MPARSLWSLVGDRFAAAALARIRRRAAVNPLFGGIVVPVDDLIGWQVFATGSFEATQLDGIEALFDDRAFAARAHEGTFVDVGANIGLYSLAFAKRFARCIAVEANPQTFKVLVANLALRDLDNVTAVCVGASDEARETILHVPTNGNLGWARLGTTYHASKAVPVSLRKLDDVVDESGASRIAMLKIDVEGHEPHVLRGATRTLTRDGPTVLYEVLGSDGGRQCRAVLDACGYRHFYRFRRRWPPGSNAVSRVFAGLRAGIPSLCETVAGDGENRAALICATKLPLPMAADVRS